MTVLLCTYSFWGFCTEISVIAFLYCCQAVRAQPAKGSSPSGPAQPAESPEAQLTWPDRSHSASKATYSPSLLNIPRASFLGFLSEPSTNSSLAKLSYSFVKCRDT